MILGFKTNINGKPTAFIDKIWTDFIDKDPFQIHELYKFKNEFRNRFSGTINFQDWDRHDSPLHDMKFYPKIHTIREDKIDRWKPGMMIDFFINVRTKDMFRFAPRVPVLSIQKITMSYAWNDIINIWINGIELTPSERLELAVNDGFDSWKEFFEYFYPVIKSTEDNFWKGKIIHWTDKKY